MKILKFLILTLFLCSVAYAGHDDFRLYRTTSSSFTLLDDTQLILGTGSDFACEYDTAQTPDSTVCGLSTDSRALLLMEKADISTNMGHAQQTNPTLFIHSADATQTTQWISLTHNQTNGVLDVGAGVVSIPDGISTAAITATGGGSLTGTWTNLGTVTTVDINGGTIDGATIGGSSAGAGTFTTLSAGTSLTLSDDVQLIVGTGSDFACEYDTAQTPDSTACGVSSDSRALIIMEKADMSTDMGHAQQTNPTLFIHSADATDTSDYVSIAHNQTSSVIDSGNGGTIVGLRLQGKLMNICYAQGADTSQVKITSCNGTALSATNPGFVEMRSATPGTNTLFKVSADVTVDLSSIDFGSDTLGDLTGMILRNYAINDNGTLRWGFGYQGGFTYIRNTQDSTTATGANLPEEIYTNGDVTTDNSPMLDVGYVIGTRNDTTNEWVTTQYHPNESADGVWQPYNTTQTGWTATPTGGTRKFMIAGKTVTVIDVNNSGTSNATTATLTIPIKTQENLLNLTGYITDAGTAQPDPGLTYGPNAGDKTVAFWLNMNAADGFTASGAKRIDFQITYESYQP